MSEARAKAYKRQLDAAYRKKWRRIINKVGNGATLEDACESRPDMPAPHMVREWIKEDKTGALKDELAQARARGRKRSARKHADALAGISFDVAKPDGIDPKRARVAMHGHGWIAERLDRETYGQVQDIKVTVEHRGVIGGSVLGHGARTDQGSPQLHSPREQAPRMIEAEVVDVEPVKPAAPEPDVDSAP